MDKIICPKCQMSSYTAATTSNVSCPFCGFLSEEGEPDSKLLDSTTQTNYAISENGFSKSAAPKVV